MYILIAAVTTALVISFLCSIFESVLLSLGAADVEELAIDGKRSGQLLRDFKSNIDVPIAAILIANTIAHTIGATMAGASYVDVFSEQSLWLFTLLFTLSVLLFTEIIPKTLGITFATQLATPVAHAIRYLTLALSPLVWMASRLSRGLRGSRKTTVTSIEEIRLLTAIGRNEGVVGVKTAGIIDNATRLHQLDARDILLPRAKVIVLSTMLDRDEVLEIVRQSGHSRFPFSPTGLADDISGVVLAKELLFSVYDHPEEIPWGDIVRETLYVPENTPLTILLQSFRSERKHIAIIVDEYGSTQGIVTLEDILEELVGEIIDESDRPIEEISLQPDGSYHVLATVEMRKLVAQLGISRHFDENVVTLSGLLAGLLDRVPLPGDIVEWNGYRFEVLSALDTRADAIRVHRL